MMRKSKSIVIATAITMLLSATTAFADTTSSNIVQIPKFSQTQSGEVHGWPKSDLVSLVTSRTLTQAQKDAIQSAILTPTLTQAQEDAIQSAILTPPKVSVAKGILKRGDNGGFKTVPVGLVTSGTLTQAQEGAIQGAITL